MKEYYRLADELGASERENARRGQPADAKLRARYNEALAKYEQADRAMMTNPKDGN